MFTARGEAGDRGTGGGGVGGGGGGGHHLRVVVRLVVTADWMPKKQFSKSKYCNKKQNTNEHTIMEQAKVFVFTRAWNSLSCNLGLRFF